MLSKKKKQRPSYYETKEDEAVKEQRRKIAAEFPFRDDFEKDFKSEDCDCRTVCAKSIPYLENFKKCNPDHFWLDMSKSNYLTMLYYNSDPPNWDEAVKQNEETLKREPCNFNALWCKGEINLRQKKFKLVQNSLKTMDEVLKDPLQLMTAKAEIGVNYTDFGPAFYQKSAELLEEVLQTLKTFNESIVSSAFLRLRLVKWKFELVRTYNRLMNNGTMPTFWESSTDSRPNYEQLFRRIKELLVQVIDSGDKIYSPEAWIEFGDAYKKYEVKVPDYRRKESLPENKTVDECFARALELGPDDVFVLERCGRHFRQRSTEISEFRNAIELLHRCVAIDPFRDVAYHHMGLAYRSIWLEAENHEEARLHNNRTKKYAEKKSMQKKLQRNNQQDNHYSSSRFKSKSLNQKGSSAIKFSGNSGTKQGPCSQETENGAIRNPASVYGRSTSENGIRAHNDPVSESSFNRRQPNSLPATPSKSFTTIPPKYPTTENEVPKHNSKKPDYFDKLRVGNPLAKDARHEDLMKAREYFQKASDIRQGRSCRYLVDLARTYVSTGDVKMARNLFVRATESNFCSNDGAYLYEQWGLMEEHELEKQNGGGIQEYSEQEGEGNEEGPTTEEVKNLFRHAIRLSVESRERSRVAFYHLRDILFRQKQENPSHVIEKEYLLLYTTIQDSKRAVEIIDTLKSDPNNIVLMWELVNLFHARSRPEDADAAFDYLALLADANKLKVPLDEKESLDEVLADRIRKVIDIAKRRLEKDDKKHVTLLKTYQWLITLSDTEPMKSKVSSKICLLAPSRDTPEVEKVEWLFKKFLGIEILEGFWDDSNDIRIGHSVPDELENMIKKVDAAVVIMQKSENELNKDEENMQHILMTFLNDPKCSPKRICRAVSSEGKMIPLGKFDDSLREWNVDGGSNENLDMRHQVQLALGLFEALFISD